MVNMPATDDREGGSPRRHLRAGGFIAGQAALMGVHALTGFLLVRGLSKGDYAAYSLTFALVSVAINATNMGLTSAVLGLGGQLWPDGRAVRSVLNAAQRLRNRIGLVLSGGFVAYCCWQFPRIGADQTHTVIMTAFLLTAAWVQMQANFYAIVLQLGRAIFTLLRNDLAAAVLKLLGVTLLVEVNGPLWMMVGWIVLCLALNYVALRRSVQPLLVNHRHADAVHLHRLTQIVRANALRTLYWSFEGQIALLLCAWFASADRLADIGALGRLGVVFGIFQAFVANYTLPDLAKAQTARRVLHLSLRTVGIAVALVAPFIGWAAVHPSSLLWILGPGYTGLTDYLLPFMLAGAIGQLAAVVYQICTARAWLSLNRYYVPMALPLQAGMIYLLDMREIENVILFSGINNLFFLTFNAAMFFFCWKRASWS